MKKRYLKVLALTMCGVLAMGAFTGCGKGADKEKEEKKNEHRVSKDEDKDEEKEEKDEDKEIDEEIDDEETDDLEVMFEEDPFINTTWQSDDYAVTLYDDETFRFYDKSMEEYADGTYSWFDDGSAYLYFPDDSEMFLDYYGDYSTLELDDGDKHIAIDLDEADFDPQLVYESENDGMYGVWYEENEGAYVSFDGDGGFEIYVDGMYCPGTYMTDGTSFEAQYYVAVNPELEYTLNGTLDEDGDICLDDEETYLYWQGDYETLLYQAESVNAGIEGSWLNESEGMSIDFYADGSAVITYGDTAYDEYFGFNGTDVLISWDGELYEGEIDEDGDLDLYDFTGYFILQ